MDTPTQPRQRGRTRRVPTEPGRGPLQEAELARLISAHQGFVFKIAREYIHLGIPLEDLVNEGNIGLLHAARRFDHLRGTRFLTYASAWIRKYILGSIQRYARLVRLPPYSLRRLRRFLHEEQALAQKLGRSPSHEEVAAGSDLRGREIESLQKCRYVEVPIDVVHPDSETGYTRPLPDPNALNPEEDLLRGEAYRLVHGALSRLSPKERTVMIGRYGLSDGRVRTLKEVAKHLGLSRERVRQIEAIARRKIVRHLVRLSRRRK